MAKLTIDGNQVELPDGTSLFEACREVRGEPLPHFCYHPDLSIAGVCRLCQVEIEGMPKLTIACNTTVRDDMVVHTNSEKVKRSVQKILEMHLINHPVDCPICDQAGECGLQDQYMEYGLYDSEVSIADKVNKAKVEVIGPHVILDKERCVLCARCTRFLDEITGTRELGIFNRGDRAEIGVAPGRELNNNYSLNTVDICPVGALTSRDFRFQKRVWLLRSTLSICPGCATGCNIRIDHEAGRIYRLKPRRNNEVNGSWMCDLGRMEYKLVHDEKRLQVPLLRKDGELEPILWQQAWSELTSLLRGEVAGLALASPGQSLEELVVYRKLFGDIFAADRIWGGLRGVGLKEGDDFLLAADRTPNRKSLNWLGLGEISPEELRQKLTGSPQRVVIYGGDPVAADSQLESALNRCDSVIYLGTQLNATARTATLVVPLSMWAEKDGLFVNKQGRIQAFHRAVPRPGESREDWRLLADLLAELTSCEAPASLPQLRRWVADELGIPTDSLGSNFPVTGLLPDLSARTPTGGDH
jgi:NADH-quinone oxidoreductase subunit G